MVKILRFKKKYGEKIKSGEKKTTIRLSTKLKPGDTVKIFAGEESLGKARIISIKRKRMSELTERDAERDGFNSVDELRRALKKHYRNISERSFVSIIEFNLMRRESKKKK